MKSIIERIRAAKTWQERAAIAENKRPGTRFDAEFERADLAVQLAEQGHTKEAQHEAAIIGAGMASIIQKRDSQKLHEIAAALAEWKRHERTTKPDYLLMTLCSMANMFPPGWEKTWGIYRGRLVKGFTRPPQDKSMNLRTNDIIKSLRSNRRFPFDEAKVPTYRKRIQTYATQLDIPLDRSKFKPKNKVRIYPAKKVG